MTSIKDKTLIQEHDIKNTEFSSVMTKKLWDFWSKAEEQTNHCINEFRYF